MFHNDNSQLEFTLKKFINVYFSCCKIGKIRFLKWQKLALDAIKIIISKVDPENSNKFLLNLVPLIILVDSSVMYAGKILYLSCSHYFF